MTKEVTQYSGYRMLTIASNSDPFLLLLQLPGICTVCRSSADSSAEFPMESKLRKFSTSFNRCAARLRCHRSQRVKGFAKKTSCQVTCIKHVLKTILKRNFEVHSKRTHTKREKKKKKLSLKTRGKKNHYYHLRYIIHIKLKL